jgi:hypothetical protein
MKKLMTLFIVLSLWLVPNSIGQDEAEAAPTQAKSAYEFTDSVGVGVHLSYWDTAYNTHFDELATRLAEAKIRHARDGAHVSHDPGAERAYWGMVHSMGARGIKFLLVFSPLISDGFPDEEYIRRTLELCGTDCDAAEGPNEEDSWSVERMRSWQSTLYNTIKSVRPDMPVGAPSYTGAPGVYEAHGSYEDIADFGNIHPYPAALNPESPDIWGHNMAKVRHQSPTELVWFTETGYHHNFSDTNHSPTPLNVAATYAPRLYLYNFMQGIPRSYWYEGIDKGGGWGLLDQNATPRPAYTAIKNTMILLDDPNGQNFTPGSLDYTISGDTANVHHLLLQKSDGKFYLALWQGVSVYDRNTKTRLYPPNKSVNLTFATNMTQIQVYKPNRQTTPIQSFSNTALISQSIPPQVKVYEITR